MMMNAMDGAPWWVEWNETYGNVDLVVPRPYSVDVAVPIAGAQWEDRRQLVILGMAYNITTGAGPLGIILNAVEGDGTTRRIYEISSAATGVISAGFPCYIELSPAGSASPVANPSKISVEVIGSLVTGNLLIWGMHAPASGRAQNGIATPPIQFV